MIQGTFNANNKNVTFGNFYTGGTATRTLTMGSGTWTMLFEGEAGAAPSFNTWQVATTTGLTFNKDTATIKLLHARNDPTTNDSQVSGLRTALTSSATTIQVTDVTPFDLGNGYVWVGEEIIYYVGVNTSTRELTIVGRGINGTTTLASVPAGTAVLGALEGRSSLQLALTAGVASNIKVQNASKFPPSGTVYIENESITYSSIDLVNNLLIASSIPVYNHSIGAIVLSDQVRAFYGGGLSYYNLVVACNGYKSTTFIYDSNTFQTIKNTNTGFTYTLTNNVYPGYIALSFQASQTNTVSSFGFTGTSSYLCTVQSQTVGTQTTLSIIPATSLWNVGTNSQNGGNNTNLYYVAGAIDYVYWKDILGLPATVSTSTGNFFLLF